jgi:hypothetical protein
MNRRALHSIILSLVASIIPATAVHGADTARVQMDFMTLGMSFQDFAKYILALKLRLTPFPASAGSDDEAMFLVKNEEGKTTHFAQFCKDELVSMQANRDATLPIFARLAHDLVSTYGQPLRLDTTAPSEANSRLTDLLTITWKARFGRVTLLYNNVPNSEQVSVSYSLKNACFDVRK